MTATKTLRVHRADADRQQREADFVAFVRARGLSLARAASVIAGSPAAGEDLLQSALADTYVRWMTGPPIEHPDAYVRTCLVNARSAWWRRRSSWELPVEASHLDRVQPDVSDALVERHDALTRLRALSRQQRTAIALRYFEDLDDAGIAQTMGLSVGSVKKHIARGLAHLRAGADPSPAVDEVAAPSGPGR